MHKTCNNFFLSEFSFTGTEDSQDSRRRKKIIFYSTLPLPPVHEHWDIYLQLCMWDDYHVFFIVTFVFTRMLLDKLYHLTKLPFDWLIDWLIDNTMFVRLLDELILGVCYSHLTWEIGGFELALTMSVVFTPATPIQWLIMIQYLLQW